MRNKRKQITMTEEKKEPTSPAEAPSGAKEGAKASAGKEKKVKVPEKFKDLVETIEELPVKDLAELVKVLEEKFGVSASAPVVAAPAGATTAEAASAEEKSVFNIELTKVGDKKIEVIKAVRDITAKGLKESKDVVDAAASSPQVLKENVKKEEAEELKKKLEAAGATVELK